MTQNNQHNKIPKDTVDESDKILTILGTAAMDFAHLDETDWKNIQSYITTAYSKGVEVEKARIMSEVEPLLETMENPKAGSTWGQLARIIRKRLVLRR